MSATYPYSSKDRLVAADLNLDLELNPGAVPPASAFGGAHIYKQWIDTSVTPPVLRMCVANPASSTYNAPDWIALATIDSTNKHFGIASVILSDTAPPSPLPGLLWWDSVGGNLYVSYFDGNSTQWVPATNTSGLPVPITIPNGGTGATTAAGALANLGAFPRQGVTDGSNAAAGQVGEVISATQAGGISIGSSVSTNVTSITLTAGDWDVHGMVNIQCSAQTIANTVSGFTTQSGTNPGILQAHQLGINTGVQWFSGAVPTQRFNVTTSTPIYLVVYALFGSGSTSAYGSIYARRMR